MKQSIYNIFALIFFLFCMSASINAQTKRIVPIDKNAAVTSLKSSISSTVKIQGQVFIATKSGVNFKLALVKVALYRENELTEQLIRNWQDQSEKRTTTAKQILDGEISLNAIHEKYIYAEQNYQNAKNYARIQDRDPVAHNAVRETLHEATQLLIQETKAEMAVEDIKQKLSEIRSYHYAIQTLDKPLVTSKTDADGNFEIVTPSGSYVLVAASERQIDKHTEKYEWMVRVDARENARVLLSNDNLTTSLCQECMKFPVRNDP